ncbi:hypothetical protein M0R72_17500 [Candidatus Pacearchaeota archaeon]|jgi:hypothetical protein|nr:hypothetical protein [Candidatus Pacearchaeota archaeon]
MQETLRHKEAFEYYLGMGQDRSIPKVAQKYSVSTAAVKKWSKAFSWQQRLKTREAKIGAKVEESTDRTIADFKADLLKAWRGAQDRWIEKFDADKINPRDYKDLETATRNILLLLGEPTERGEMSVDVPVEKLAEKLDAIANNRAEAGGSQQSDTG